MAWAKKFKELANSKQHGFHTELTWVEKVTVSADDPFVTATQ